MAQIKKCYLRFFEIYSNLANLLSQISIILGYALLIIVTIVVLIGVFYRYILNDPLSWTEETARYILIWTTLLATSVTIKERKTIRLITIIKRVPEKNALILEMIFYIFIIFIIGVIAKYSLIMVLTRSINILSPAMQINMFWPQSSLPIGFGLILFQSLYIFFEDIKIIATGESFKEKIGV